MTMSNLKSSVDRLLSQAQGPFLARNPHMNEDDFCIDGLELFGLEHMSYNGDASRMALSLLHVLFHTDNDGPYDFSARHFAETFGFEFGAVEVLVYVLAARRDGDENKLFCWGGSPRCMWPTARGWELYEKFQRAQLQEAK